MKKSILLICLTLICQILFGQWEIITNGQYPDIQKIDFPTNEIGYACGKNFILKTIDGGETWNKIDVDYDFKTLDFPTELIGYAAGKDSTICKTIDGGLTWIKLNIPNLTSPFLNYNSVTFKNEDIGFIVGGGLSFEDLETWISDGYILKTINGGETWNYIYTWTEMKYIFIIEGTNTVYAAGGTKPPWESEQILLKSVDLGENWIQIEDEIETPIISINCFDEQNIILNGCLSVYYSNDSAVSFNYFSFDTLYINDSYLINSGDFFLVGSNSNIFKYSKENSIFEKIIIENLDNDLFDIEMTKNKVGFIVGSDGLILRNTNITSIMQQEISDINISIFPNPTTDKITLNFQEFSEYEIKIYNSEKVIKSITIIGNKTDLNIANLPSGVYFIKIKSKAGGKWTKKIVKI